MKKGKLLIVSGGAISIHHNEKEYQYRISTSIIDGKCLIIVYKDFKEYFKDNYYVLEKIELNNEKVSKFLQEQRETLEQKMISYVDSMEYHICKDGIIETLLK